MAWVSGSRSKFENFTTMSCHYIAEEMPIVDEPQQTDLYFVRATLKTRKWLSSRIMPGADVYKHWSCSCFVGDVPDHDLVSMGILRMTPSKARRHEHQGHQMMLYWETGCMEEVWDLSDVILHGKFCRSLSCIWVKTTLWHCGNLFIFKRSM